MKIDYIITLNKIQFSSAGPHSQWAMLRKNIRILIEKIDI